MEKLRIDSYHDERANRYFDIFPNLEGQVTVSIVTPNTVSGWHRHKIQSDQFFVVKGVLTVTTISPKGVVRKVELSASSPCTITILPNYWHGWRSYEDEVTLIYYLSEKHDESDEYRASRGAIYSEFGVDL